MARFIEAQASRIRTKVSALVALCAKQANRIRSKSKIGSCSNSSSSGSPKVAQRSPLATPKHLLATISNKATIPFMNKKKTGNDYDGEEEFMGFGDGGLWQRGILMGEKCQPIEFSGVIYYDNDGKQLPELPPRSPRYTFPAGGVN